MALWQIKELSSGHYRHCADYPNVPLWKHLDWFCTPTNPHMESWTHAYWFYYCPPLDSHVLFYLARWPWDMVGGGLGRNFYNAQTLERDTELDDSIPGGYSVFGEVYLVMTTFVESGTWGKCFLYNRWNWGWVREVSPYNIKPFDGAWSINFDDSLPNAPDSFSNSPNGGIVNLQTGYIVLSFGNKLMFWKNLLTEPEYMGWLYNPDGSLMDLAYESTRYLWAIGSSGTVMKIDYTIPRVELCSKIVNPDPAVDLKYLISFDPKRGRLVLYRHRSDDPVDGSNRSMLEAYRPIPKAGILTDPVPLKPLRVGSVVPFESFLLGDAGEGIAPCLVSASLQSPASGRLLQAGATTKTTGQAVVDYLCPAEPVTERMIMSVTTDDGEL